MRTLAAVAVAPHAPFRLEELDLDEPRPDEVLVELVATGICHTDLGARDGRLPSPLPMVLGHEGAGRVVAVGDAVTSVHPGDEVLLVADRCGACSSCRAGMPTYCRRVVDVAFSGVRRDGTPRAHRLDGSPVRASFFGQSSFARHALATERNLVPVGPGARLEVLAALTCGIPTGAGSVLYGLPVGPGSAFAVLGAGAVGCAALMAAVAAGATTVVAVDRLAFRLELAVGLGATATLEVGAGTDVSSALAGLAGDGFDAVLDTAGNEALLAAGLDALGPLGVCGFVTTRSPQVTVPMGRMLPAGRSLRALMGGHAAPEVLVPRLLELHAAGRFPFERLLRHYPFEAINQAAADAASGAAVKPVLTFAGAG